LTDVITYACYKQLFKNNVINAVGRSTQFYIIHMHGHNDQHDWRDNLISIDTDECSQRLVSKSSRSKTT
jgi:hypothetical protein